MASDLSPPGRSRGAHSEQHNSGSFTLPEESVEGGGGGSEWCPLEREIYTDHPGHVPVDSRLVLALFVHLFFGVRCVC